ncbi:MAG: transporter [Gammaproteobacteria bacterium]|nr:MAG: transporter [Gammaproteobacteria bacterium]
MKRELRICLILALSVGNAVAAQETRISLGAYFSTGDYGASSNTDIQSLSLGIRHKTGPWTLKASLPWLRIEGSSNVLPDGTVISRPGVRKTREGLGDINLGVGYRLFYDQTRRIGASLRGKVKLPTADEDESLGTGETDYTIELAPYGLWSGTTLFGALGYRFYGDTATTDYRDVWLARLGFSYPLTAEQAIGVSASYRQNNRAGKDDRRSLMLFHSWKPDPAWGLQTYLIKGFGDSTADLAGGASLIRNF